MFGCQDTNSAKHEPTEGRLEYAQRYSADNSATHRYSSRSLISLPRYLWFHAFRRNSFEDVLEALRQGPTVPTGATTTQQNEAELGISPACVYAYLGMPSEEFGDVAFALPAEALGGVSCPFDSGGLVRHIPPVNGWDTDRRRGFLSANSWPTASLPDRLNAYPGASPDRVRDYLDGKRPIHNGPHEVFPPPSEQFIAPIWRDGTSVSAWLWEGRVPGRLPAGVSLHRWSCASSAYHDLIRHTEGVTDPDEIAWLEWLLARWVKGGVAALGRTLRSFQEVA